MMRQPRAREGEGATLQLGEGRVQEGREGRLVMAGVRERGVRDPGGWNNIGGLARFFLPQESF